MSYPRRVYDVIKWDGENNGSVYERCGMGPCTNGVKCGLVVWMKKKFGGDSIILRERSEESVCE